MNRQDVLQYSESGYEFIGRKKKRKNSTSIHKLVLCVLFFFFPPRQSLLSLPYILVDFVMNYLINKTLRRKGIAFSEFREEIPRPYNSSNSQTMLFVL